MDSRVSWPLWLTERTRRCAVRPLVEACMLQYTRSPSAPVMLMQGPSTSAALRNGPGLALAASAASAVLWDGSERTCAADAAEASAPTPSAADAPAEGSAESGGPSSIPAARLVSSL